MVPQLVTLSFDAVHSMGRVDRAADDFSVHSMGRVDRAADDFFSFLSVLSTDDDHQLRCLRSSGILGSFGGRLYLDRPMPLAAFL
jgi:hypothetical protein